MRPVARFAWGLLGYDLATVAWGAYVRATGSGAGCGRHWPLCNGQMIPHAPRTATLIELSHRVSSGIALLLTLALALWTFRVFPKGHLARRSAAAAAALMGTEALIGAAIVLLQLVDHNESMARAFNIGAHLFNTFLLLAATSLTGWWASLPTSPQLRLRGVLFLVLGVPIVAVPVVGASGAVTALGDTLYPPTSLATGFAQDFSSSAPLFVRLRTIHPLLAVGTAAAIVVAGSVARILRPTRHVRLLSRAAASLAVVQIGVGLLDVTLLAPLAIQIVHLLLADAVWITLVLAAAAACTAEAIDLPATHAAIRCD
jgi:heme A synthase